MSLVNEISCSHGGEYEDDLYPGMLSRVGRTTLMEKTVSTSAT
jgi:hypothetical protein